MPTLTSAFQEIFGFKAFRSGASFDGGEFRVGTRSSRYALFANHEKDRLGFFTSDPQGKVDFAPDTDNYFRMGRGWVGYDGTNSDWAGFGHVDVRSANGTALRQSAGGVAHLQANTAASISFRIGGTEYGFLSATRWDFNRSNLDHDFRIRGDNETNLFYTDAFNDRVGFGTATPSALVDITDAGIGASPDDTQGLALINTTAAADGVPQFSPPVRQRGFGWDVAAGASQSVDFRTHVKTENGATAPGGSWRLDVSLDGGAYNTALEVNTGLRLLVGGGTTPPAIAGKLHVEQAVTTAAIPSLYLTQADLSEEMIEFNATVGTGNPVEAVAAKTLTTTHFVRVSITGVGMVYLPVGTIA